MVCAVLVCCTLFNFIVLEVSPAPQEYETSVPLFLEEGYPKSGDIPLLNRMIFLGRRVSIWEHPYVLSVRRRYAHYITGSLLTANIAITVAHPLFKVQIHELGIVVGENYADRGTFVHTIIIMVIHEHFDPYTLKGDLALLRMYEEVQMRMSVKPIQMYPRGTVVDGSIAFVTGWGRCDRTGWELCLPRSSDYYPGEIQDPMLRSISFTVKLPNFYCEGYKRSDITIEKGMLCLGEAREENPVIPCLAVPGAPLLVNARLLGLQSWGFGCGYDHDLPLVYTDLSYYRRWVENNVKILRDVSQSAELTELHRATKSYTFYNLLSNTRLVKPRVAVRYETSFQLLEVDKKLIKLRGTAYDIRDFLEDGAHSNTKQKLYDELKKYLNYSLIQPFPLKGIPFLSNDSEVYYENGKETKNYNSADYNNENESDLDTIYKANHKNPVDNTYNSDFSD